MSEPYYADEAVTLHHGNCLDVLRTLADASVDSVVTDPPYGLGFMGKEWDKPGRAARATTTSIDLASHNPFKQGRVEYGGASYGGQYLTGVRHFQQWCEAWSVECLRVLKPGGHMLAFGGSRTWHRLAVAVEDAGFEIRDSIAWLYGSGFPKSLDVSKAIDKAAGADREVVGRYQPPNGAAWNLTNDTATPGGGGATMGGGKFGTRSAGMDITAPATEAAKQWQGWGTALKPAFEPVVCARKPFSAVPLEGEADRLHHLIGALLWQAFTPAKRAALSSPSSHHEPPAAWCVSARVAAALTQSPGASEPTDTFSSPALASTSSSIVSSWSAILAALSGQTRTSTTSTASSTTTALRTLSSLLAPVTSPTTMPPCGCLTHGPSSTAPSAESSSSDDWSNWLHTLSASAPATATEGIALAAASVLAQVAASLSSDRAAGSSADPSATTGADARGSRPAFEPIVVGRKPLTGTVASTVLEHGTGALNIDGCRIEGPPRPEMVRTQTVVAASSMSGTSTGATASGQMTTAGRWPTNVVLDESQAVALDQETGVTRSARNTRKAAGGVVGNGNTHGRMVLTTENVGGYDDEGGASRFFPVFRYEAKAPTSERPTYWAHDCDCEHDVPMRPDGSCLTCGTPGTKVAHPTVKPLDLMRWLVRLVTPPGGTVLEPFAGSGTTAEACVIEGFRCIAIEREADYLPLIVARLTKPIQIGLDFGGVA